MHIKDSEESWAICQNCGAKIRMSKGGHCKCGDVEVTKPDERGVQMIVGDSDELVIDNE